MKTFVFSAHPYDTPFLERATTGKHDLGYTDKKLSLATAGMAAGYEAIALFTADDASAPVLDKLNGLGIRYITLRSAGYDHIDVTRAKAIGMKVARVPAYSPYSIAEHAVALLLALNRKITESQMLIRLQDYRLDTLAGFDIHGKTIGVIGTGIIGMAFARIMHGFGTTILGYDPVQNQEAATIGMKYVSLDDLLTQCDVISLHCPLNDNTRYLISKPQLDKIKKGCILINTARGGIVNTTDLLHSLESNHLGGACLDVYEKEKSLFFEDHRSTQLCDPLFSRLITNKKVIVTGHQAFLTHEALTGIAETTSDNLSCWTMGKKCENEL
jgi:D-lactate dehydrogenase